jgi:hypothetical protein
MRQVPIMAEPRRIIEALCSAHAADVWPIAGPLSDLIDRCRACEARTDRLRDPLGGLHLRALLDLSTADYDRITAVHEAAHAIVGTLTGHSITQVRINLRGEAIQTGPGGNVTFGPFNLPIDRHVAMTWAGQRAGLRWLAENGHDTEANRVDVTYLGWDDTTYIRSWTDHHSLPVTTGRDLADSILTERWAAVGALADVLTRQRCLLGTEIDDVLKMTTGSYADGAS